MPFLAFARTFKQVCAPLCHLRCAVVRAGFERSEREKHAQMTGVGADSDWGGTEAAGPQGIGGLKD